MKKASIFLMCTTLIFSSCIKEPTACIDTLPETIDVYEDVTLNSSCSEEAESVLWTYEDMSGSSIFISPTILENSENSFDHSWDSPGRYEITLTAYSKKEKEKDQVSTMITVLDLCYECEYDNWSYYSVCASLYTSEDEFMREIEDLESQGYKCTKK